MLFLNTHMQVNLFGIILPVPIHHCSEKTAEYVLESRALTVMASVKEGMSGGQIFQ